MSLSLISVISVIVISLIIWLMLVFLSVIDGLERNWIVKLTSLNGPIQITPTSAYYSSYYYQIDSMSHASRYASKSIGEKLLSPVTDPYVEGEDLPLPDGWPKKVCDPDGLEKDLVKLVFDSIVRADPHLIAQEYEISGAMLQLLPVRSIGPSFTQDQREGQSQLMQLSYLSSLCPRNPYLPSLLSPPRVEDINHLFFLASLSPASEVQGQNEQTFEHMVNSLLLNLTIEEIRTTARDWLQVYSLLPENVHFQAIAIRSKGGISCVVLPLHREEEGIKRDVSEGNTVKGILVKTQKGMIFTPQGGEQVVLSRYFPVALSSPLHMKVKKVWKDSPSTSMRQICFDITTEIQKRVVGGVVRWEGVEISQAVACTRFAEVPQTPPLWPYVLSWGEGRPERVILPTQKGKDRRVGLILPRSFQKHDICLGDRGYIAYNALVASSVQEHRLSCVVSGFYDPGVLSAGMRPILMDQEVVHYINSSSQSSICDQNMVNGIRVWSPRLNHTEEIYRKLIDTFKERDLLPYWQVTPYYEYEFAKDFLLQFQSDKYLFTIVGILILIVACCNIISLLIILIHHKKKEIAILRAIGATKRSIAYIFTLCGGIIGLISTLIGTLGAMLTLHYLDHVIHFLSMLQGREALNPLFFGVTLPNQLSMRSVLFVCIAAPLFSLAVAFVPAYKACRLLPSPILQSGD